MNYKIDIQAARDYELKMREEGFYSRIHTRFFTLFFALSVILVFFSSMWLYTYLFREKIIVGPLVFAFIITSFIFSFSQRADLTLDFFTFKTHKKPSREQYFAELKKSFTSHIMQTFFLFIADVLLFALFIPSVFISIITLNKINLFYRFGFMHLIIIDQNINPISALFKSYRLINNVTAKKMFNLIPHRWSRGRISAPININSDIFFWVHIYNQLITQQ